jgi:hypothetical protein
MFQEKSARKGWGKKASWGRRPVHQLRFFNGNGVVLANLDAGFASETLFLVDRNGFFILQLVNFYGTDIDTFAAANTLLGINSHVIRHTYLQKS